MTRSKELRRIELALDSRDRDEPEWAAGDCRLRLGFIDKKHDGARVRRLLKQVEAALGGTATEK